MTEPTLEDFRALLAAAEAVKEHAYAPYSRFRVGAAVLTKSGQRFVGCNVENASFGLTLCAERVALTSAVAAGEREFLAVAIATDKDEPVSPCGACRQVLAEFGPDMTVVLPGKNGPSLRPLDSLLPSGFGPADLPPPRRDAP
ncbi:MAG: cytidine deaminase, partial [Planctomycetota bacterium]